MKRLTLELAATQYEALLGGLSDRGLSVERGPVDPASGESRVIVRRRRAGQRLHVKRAAGGRYRVWPSYDLTWPWRWPAQARVYGDIVDCLLEVTAGGGGGPGHGGAGT